MTLLPLRVRHYDYEPIHSLEHRLATRWRRQPTAFLASLTLPPKNLRTTAEFERVAELSGKDLAALLQSSPRRLDGGRKVLVGEAWVDLAELTTMTRRFCPICISEDRALAARSGAPVDTAAWARLSWLVKPIATCTEHEQLLLSHCSHCSRETRRNDPAIDRCSCGALLCDRRTSPSVSEVDRLMIALMDGTAPAEEFPGASLAGISSHLTRLGKLQYGWQARCPELTGAENLKARDDGLTLFRAGHDQIAKALDLIVSKAVPGRSGYIGVTQGYGWCWTSWLGVPTQNPLDISFRSIVLQHAAAHGLVARPAQDGATLNAACERLGASHTRGRKILTSAGLLPNPVVRGVRSSIDMSSVGKIAARLERGVNAAQAAQILGIGRASFRRLVAEGIVLPDRQITMLRAGRVFQPEDLQRLVRQVADNAPRLSVAPPQCLTLSDVSRTASLPLERVVSAILQGRLAAAAQGDEIGFQGIWIAKREVSLLKGRNSLTIRSAAERFSMHYDAARWLAARGEFGEGPGSISRTGLDRFEATYVTAAKVGLRLGISGGRVSGLLRSRSIEPAFGPPSCRQRIWHQHVLESLRGANL